jgi:EPS-associated MarR family transcriptional regulator
VNEDVRFRILNILKDKPDLSQREIADELGVSLGAINYVLKALVEKGQVKVRNFRVSNKKLRYAYVLTPSGIEAKARLTTGFLKRKYAEYEALKSEIEELEADLSNSHAGVHLRDLAE